MPVHSSKTAAILPQSGLPHAGRRLPREISMDRTTLAWLWLLLAGLLEIAWAIGLKTTQGFSRLVPTLWTLAGMIASFWFLARAVRDLPVGTAYAVWTGIGALGTAALGMLLLGEPATPPRLVALALVVAGIVGLKLTS
jgi:quaternary ammonium compound-resistance protein SugE